MANPISYQLKIGTLGELLVQLRLLQYDIQAAPPLKDSGNDLIAIKQECFKAIQVKTTTNGKFTKPDNTITYHILAVVNLKGSDNQIALDQSEIYLIPKGDVETIRTNTNNLDEKYKLDHSCVNILFNNSP
jgi:hypothetical protein